MDFTKLSNEMLLERTERLVRSERKITHLVLWHINEVECRRLFADLGFSSMYKYLTQHFGYGESAAYERLHASRLLKNIPELSEKIENGTLNLTQMVQVQKCIREEAKSGNKVSLGETLQVLEQIENLTTYETKKVLAVEFNQPIQTHEVIKPQRDESVWLGLSFSAEQMEELRHAKDLLSHVLPESTWAEVISYMARKQIQKIEGKAVSPTKDASSKELTPGFSVAGKTDRKSIKITTRRALNQKANNCCEFVSPQTGKVCGGTYQLQIDHRVPLALGGSNKIENLRVLCRTHNLSEARKMGI
jgi:hypothetical protein